MTNLNKNKMNKNNKKWFPKKWLPAKKKTLKSPSLRKNSPVPLFKSAQPQKIYPKPKGHRFKLTPAILKTLHKNLPIKVPKHKLAMGYARHQLFLWLVKKRKSLRLRKKKLKRQTWIARVIRGRARAVYAKNRYPIIEAISKIASVRYRISTAKNKMIKKKVFHKIKRFLSKKRKKRRSLGKRRPLKKRFFLKIRKRFLQKEKRLFKRRHLKKRLSPLFSKLRGVYKRWYRKSRKISKNIHSRLPALCSQVFAQIHYRKAIRRARAYIPWFGKRRLWTNVKIAAPFRYYRQKREQERYVTLQSAVTFASPRSKLELRLAPYFRKIRILSYGRRARTVKTAHGWKHKAYIPPRYSSQPRRGLRHVKLNHLLYTKAITKNFIHKRFSNPRRILRKPIKYVCTSLPWDLRFFRKKKINPLQRKIARKRTRAVRFYLTQASKKARVKLLRRIRIYFRKQRINLRSRYFKAKPRARALLEEINRKFMLTAGVPKHVQETQKAFRWRSVTRLSIENPKKLILSRQPVRFLPPDVKILPLGQIKRRKRGFEFFTRNTILVNERKQEIYEKQQRDSTNRWRWRTGRPPLRFKPPQKKFTKKAENPIRISLVIANSRSNYFFTLTTCSEKTRKHQNTLQAFSSGKLKSVKTARQRRDAKTFMKLVVKVIDFLGENQIDSIDEVKVKLRPKKRYTARSYVLKKMFRLFKYKKIFARMIKFQLLRPHSQRARAPKRRRK